jgi:glucuronate isomerase
MTKLYQELKNYIDSIEIIDTHEHLPSNEKDRDKNVDVIKEYLVHYFNRDLISAGLTKEDYTRVIKSNLTVSEKWRIIEPYWETCRFTGYGRAIEKVIKDIYFIKKLDKTTIEELNNKFLKTLSPGHFKLILKDKCRIKTSLLNVNTLNKEYELEKQRSIYCDRNFFTPVFMISDIIFPKYWVDIENVELQSGIRITSFSRWLEAIEVLIEKSYSLGSVALKNNLAYFRTLQYERTLKSKAEEGFNNIFKTKHYFSEYPTPIYTSKAFQDYMFHYILDIANKKNLVVQIHTGIQEGSGNILSNSNPELLSNLFLEYPDVSFDIFHASYPFQNILTVLSKNYPNVYINMCWVHIISPVASVNLLLELLETVPLNKICAFGGDYLFIDGVYGHLEIAKENVAKALTIKVKEGLFDIEEAKVIAKKIFFDNPLKLFAL